MVRVRRAAIVRRVARDAAARESRINLVFVAGSAIERRVSARQNESRNPAVVEIVAAPAVRAGVARLAGRGKLCGLMVRRPNRGIVSRVAGHAIRAQTPEYACRRAFVARLAIRGFVGAEKRKTVCVTFSRREGNAPPTDRVTLLAGAPHLAAVKIRVAIGTLLSDTGKNKPGVALPAFHARMHSAERERSLGVFEVGEWANRPVAGGRVAAAAGDFQRTVRTRRPALFAWHAGRRRAVRFVQRVAPGAHLTRGTVPEGGVPAALLILGQSAVAVQALELEPACAEVMTIGAISGTAQHSVLFGQRAGRLLRVA